MHHYKVGCTSFKLNPTTLRREEDDENNERNNIILVSMNITDAKNSLIRREVDGDLEEQS